MTNFIQTNTLPRYMGAERIEAVIETAGNAKSLTGRLLATFVSGLALSRDAVKRPIDRESADSASSDAEYIWGL